MLEFFTYTSLGTLTGAITATVLVVEFLKEFKIFELFTTRWLVLAVAEMIMFSTGIAGDNFTCKDLPICFLNGLLVAACAMGSCQIVYRRFLGKSRRF